MRTARLPTGASIGLLVLLCGCYHYPYSPYGGYGYGPGTYPVVPGDGGLGTGPTYVPYGNPPTGPGPTPINPNGSPTPNWQPGGNGGGSAPPYSPGTGDGSENPVPNPTDEEPFGGGAPAGASLTPGADHISGSGIHLEPIETEPSAPTGAAAPSNVVADNDPVEENDPFETPMRTTSGGTNVAARTASLANTSNQPNPFAHDAKFTWLRGIVDFDPQDQRWVIVYSADPEGSDRYGGSLTLSDHAALAKIKPGDVVLVDGAVDASSLDQHGKPIYRIDKLQPLRPKG